MHEKLITTREASRILNISERDVIDLAQANVLPHFSVAGEYVRFKKEDILQNRAKIRKKFRSNVPKSRKWEALHEFFYFNDFYIICTGIIVALLWVILRDVHSF